MKQAEPETMVEFLQKEHSPGCGVANGYLICRCGKCTPEDYQLPDDYPPPQPLSGISSFLLTFGNQIPENIREQIVDYVKKNYIKI